MPVVIAQAIRWLIISLIQSGAFIALINLLDPLLTAAKKAVQNTFGLSDQDAMTYVANFLLDTVELAGLTFIALRTKLPLKFADRLGFTSRGYVRGALPAVVSAGANAPGTLARAAVNAGSMTQAKVIEVVAKSKGLTFAKINDGLSLVLKIAALPVGVAFAVGQAIDWAAWDGSAYQSTFQKIFSSVGLNPDAGWRKPQTTSDDVFKKVYSTFEIQNAYAISDPFKLMSLPFNRDNLLDLLDKVGSQLLLEKGSASTKDVLATVTAMVRISGVSGTGNTGVGAGAGTSTGTGESTGTRTSTLPKVFTGVISQGIVGKGMTFTERPDDLIESVEELREAAANNLAPYLATVLSKIVYEVKVVASVITKEGFKQTGLIQKLQVGTFKDGSPKYKTVANKFATLNIYAVTEKNSRAKLATIVLGPTNSAKLTVGLNDLRELESKLPSLVTTQDTNEIKEVRKEKEKDTPPVEVPKPIMSATGKWGVLEVPAGSGVKYQIGPYTKQRIVNNALGDIESAYRKVKITINYNIVDGEAPGFPEWKSVKDGAQVVGASAPDTDTVVSQGLNQTTQLGMSATTLGEWYQAQGQTLPSVEQRSILYSELGLGQASYYTGTGEQNTKLLQALKAR